MFQLHSEAKPSMAGPNYEREMTIKTKQHEKYHAKNPIARGLVEGFLRTFDSLAALQPTGRAFEAGCAEGVLSRRLYRNGWSVDAIDIDAEALSQAHDLSPRGEGPRYAHRSIYDLEAGELAAYDLVVCCEVLEHLPDPVAGLAALRRAGARQLILSVPREPLWRALNMARLKYLAAFGNTPGHLNHWSGRAFRRFVESQFTIEAVRHPLPWTVLTARSPGAAPDR